MEPEEMDVVELLDDVAVEPSWRVKPDTAPARLTKGQRGMVVHRRDQTPVLFDVEFLDSQTQEPVVLATLPASQLRVVEHDDLIVE